MISREPPRAAIVIRVTIETTEPLTGTATARPHAGVRFDGWLGLLAALAELVGPAERPDCGCAPAADVDLTDRGSTTS